MAPRLDFDVTLADGTVRKVRGYPAGGTVGELLHCALRTGATTASLSGLRLPSGQTLEAHAPAALLAGCGAAELVTVYERVRKIGEGSFGRVYLLRHLETGERSVYKKLGGGACEVLREVAALQALGGHAHVLGLRGAVLLPADSFLFVEHAAGGSLDTRLTAGPLERAEALRCEAQLLGALAHCHACGVVHRDVKPANMLLCGDGGLRLADFGGAKPGASAFTPERTPYWYRAPEVIMGRGAYSFAADVWSAGCVLVEMVTGVPPFTSNRDACHELEVLISIVRVRGAPDPASWPEVRQLPFYHADLPKIRPQRLAEAFAGITAAEADLLDGLLAMCPHDRLSAGEAGRHPCFNVVRCADAARKAAAAAAAHLDADLPPPELLAIGSDAGGEASPVPEMPPLIALSAAGGERAGWADGPPAGVPEGGGHMVARP